MLWYKAWRESRVRFLITALTLIAFCVFTVLFEPFIQTHGGLLIPLHLRKAAYSEYIYNLIYSGQAKGLFALLVIFLGIGGLQRERSHNTAVLTLVLPVSRLRVIGTQIALGAVQLGILALCLRFWCQVSAQLPINRSLCPKRCTSAYCGLLAGL
jgi:ABC-2 type transport system permease protein